MKRIKPLLVVGTLLVGNAHAQVDFSFQGTQTGSGNSSSTGGTVNPSNPGNVVGASETSKICVGADETKVPLNLIQGLLRKSGATLQVSHDINTGQIYIRGGAAVSNCSPMLAWNLRAPTESFPQYVVEVNVKPCGSDSCSYKVMAKDANNKDVAQDFTGKPTLEGFVDCLKATGALSSDGRPDPKKIVERELVATLPGATATGQVWFAGQVPSAKTVNEKKKESKDCDHYEDIVKGGFAIYSKDDADRNRLDEEAQLICKSGNYQQIADFMSKYEQYQGMMGAVRDNLILKDYKDLANSIRAGKDLGTLNYSLIGDFQKYIIDPLTTKIAMVHEQVGKLPAGSQARREKEKELETLKKQLNAYKANPYIAEKDVDKLLANGLFDEAETMKGIHLTAFHYSRIGTTQSGLLITPKVAQDKVAIDLKSYKTSLVEKREEYQIKTGQITGIAEEYSANAQAYSDAIPVVIQNYQALIQEEQKRITPGGYCYKYFRNTQKCVQESLAIIENLKQNLQVAVKELNDEATYNQQLAAKYETLESEGRRYVAAQNGEEVVAENKPRVPRANPNTTVPTITNRSQPDGMQFDWPNQQQMPTQQQGGMPGMQYNPMLYGQQNYQPQQQQFGTGFFGQGGFTPGGNAFMGQNPFMQQPYGQQQMGGMQNGAYTFNFNNAMSMQQPYGNYGAQGYGGNMWGGAQPYGAGAGWQGYQGMGAMQPQGYSMMPGGMGGGMQNGAFPFQFGRM